MHMADALLSPPVAVAMYAASAAAAGISIAQLRREDRLAPEKAARWQSCPRSSLPGR